MKFKSLFLSFLAALSFSAVAETDWQPISSYNVPGTKAYVDADATQRANTKDGIFVQAYILIAADKPFIILSGTEKLTARSSVKHVMIECRSARFTTIADYYFKEEKPKDADVPIAQTDNGPRGVVVIPKTNFVYITLCAAQT
jgi:hypothetical protein